MYWLRVPFSSSTGAAKAQVMKKAIMPEEEIMLKENDGKDQTQISDLKTQQGSERYEMSKIYLREAFQQGESRSQRETLLNAPESCLYFFLLQQTEREFCFD